jgi:hypothetical protein
VNPDDPDAAAPLKSPPEVGPAVPNSDFGAAVELVFEVAVPKGLLPAGVCDPNIFPPVAPLVTGKLKVGFLSMDATIDGCNTEGEYS